MRACPERRAGSRPGARSLRDSHSPLTSGLPAPSRIPACAALTPASPLLPLRLFLGVTFIYAGAGVAILEIAIGLCALFGLATRYAAAGGLALNLLLFLTASWNTSPYFLGSDIVFAFAWLPFVLTGAEGQPALDHVAERGSPAVARR